MIPNPLWPERCHIVRRRRGEPYYHTRKLNRRSGSIEGTICTGNWLKLNEVEKSKQQLLMFGIIHRRSTYGGVNNSEFVVRARRRRRKRLSRSSFCDASKGNGGGERKVGGTKDGGGDDDEVQKISTSLVQCEEEDDDQLANSVFINSFVCPCVNMMKWRVQIQRAAKTHLFLFTACRKRVSMEKEERKGKRFWCSLFLEIYQS